MVSLLERARREPILAAQLSRTRVRLVAAEAQVVTTGQRSAELVAEVDRLRSAQGGAVAKAEQRDRMVAMLRRLPLDMAANDHAPVALLGAAIQRLGTLEAANATLGGQNAQMRQAFLHVRGGSGLPYCWPTATGQPEYMFVLRIRDGDRAGDSSVVVSDFDPKPRPDAPEWAMVRDLPRGELISTARFMSATAALRARSTADKCLYAMQAIDRTGPTNKAAYKNFWGQVSQPRFYVREADGR